MQTITGQLQPSVTTEPVTNIYDALVKAGVTISNHCSDLYCPVTPTTSEILKQFPEVKKSATIFRNQITKTMYYDLPFQYIPFWDKVTARC